jgi:hypothetical protein
MNIGDKVRLVHGKEQGIVRKITSDRVVEVEIEDGFTIPVKRSELVLVNSKEESKAFSKEDIAKSTAAIPSNVTSGLYLSLVGPDQMLDLYVINNTDFDVLITYGDERDGKYKGQDHAMIEKRSYEVLGQKTIENFENWGTLVFQVMLHRKGINELKTPYIKKLKLKASSLHKSKQVAPIILRDSYLFQLDKDAEDIEPEMIISGIKNTTNAAASEIKKPEKLIDLHIEKIIQQHHALSPAEKLRMRPSPQD